MGPFTIISTLLSYYSPWHLNPVQEKEKKPLQPIDSGSRNYAIYTPSTFHLPIVAQSLDAYMAVLSSDINPRFTDTTTREIFERLLNARHDTEDN